MKLKAKIITVAIALSLAIALSILLSILLSSLLSNPNLYAPTKVEWGGAEVESVARGVRITVKQDGRYIRITANEMRQTGNSVTAFDVTVLDDGMEMTAGKATFKLTPLGVEDLLLEDNPRIRSVR